MGIVRLLVAASLAAAVAGCGAAEAPETSRAVALRATGPVDAQRTAGRTGEATLAAAGSEPVRLARGGRIDPAARRGARRRDGVGAGAACTATDLVPTAESLAQVEDALLCLLNGERADRGLPALAESPQLARAALGHASDMVANRYFAHEGLDGSTMTDRIAASGYLDGGGDWVIGENLAWGSGALATAGAIMDAWMNSAGHRANILEARFSEIGMGSVLGNPAGGDAGATYAHAFGRRDGEPATDAAAASPEGATVVAERRTVPTRRQLRRQRRACARL